MTRGLSDRPLHGITLTLFAYAVFTGIDTSAKWLVQAGLPVGQVVFVRFAMHTVCVLALFLPGMGIGLFRTGALGLELARALCLLAGTALNFAAIKFLPLTLTATIFFTTPLWIAALSVPLLGERVGPRRWTAILVGFVGVLIAVQPWEAEAHWAVLLSLGAALSAALYGILTRKLSGTDDAATQQIYAAALATLAVAPVALGEWVWPATAIDWTALALVGVFGFLGHQCLTAAHRFAPASTLAPFIYIHLLYMSAASWAVFAEPPRPSVILGGLIVLASGLYLWNRERKLAGSCRGSGGNSKAA